LDLKETLDFSDVVVLCVPTKAMRVVLKEWNKELTKPTLFIYVSKGIEPEISLRVSEIVEEEIDEKNLMGYVALSGPSHAEEVILRKATALVAASKN
jgi:glycerol-3-phosphate dehydrogenase (NAD(P)+)